MLRPWDSERGDVVEGPAKIWWHLKGRWCPRGISGTPTKQLTAGGKRVRDHTPLQSGYEQRCGNTRKIATQRDGFPKSRRAVELDPTYIDAQNNLGNVFKEIGQVIEAERCIS